MKASFTSNDHRAIKSEHRHDANLEGQMVVIDCDHKVEAVRIDLYKKGQTYYCCLWITDLPGFFVTGSGKAKTRSSAVYAALDSAGISFDHPLPELGSNFDIQVWGKLEYVFTAIAEAAGATNCYVHHCMRSN